MSSASVQNTKPLHTQTIGSLPNHPTVRVTETFRRSDGLEATTHTSSPSVPSAEAWNEYYMRRPTNTDDMYPAALELTLDKFERTMKWLVWGITGVGTAAIIITGYQLFANYLY